MDSDVFDAPGVVVMLKLAERSPGATVTVNGTCAHGSLDVRLTTVPLGGATVVRKTDPTVDVPPVTVLGATTT